MTEPVKKVTFGGLTFDENLVSSKTKNNDGTFTITFKSGESMTYPEQKTYLNESQIYWKFSNCFKMKDRKTVDIDNAPELFKSTSSDNYLKPSITCQVQGGIFTDTSNFTIANVMGATFTSSRKNIDKVNLQDCYNCHIDLGANESRIYGDKVIIESGKGNEAVLDKKDTAWINAQRVKGEGTAAQDSYGN